MGTPHEWLKRTKGNDWVYYSTGGYAGVFEAIGEYYLPNFAYPPNNLLGGQPFCENTISGLTNSWYQRLTELSEGLGNAPEPVRHFTGIPVMMKQLPKSRRSHAHSDAFMNTVSQQRLNPVSQPWPCWRGWLCRHLQHQWW